MDQITDKPRARSFTYRKPQDFSEGRSVVMLALTDRMSAVVQVLKSKGGETNLHKHPRLDGFWMVLKGRARFYGENDVILDELGPNEGILIPRGLLYWFENCGDEDLEILQVDAFEQAIPTLQEVIGDRVDATPRKRNLNQAAIAKIHEGRKAPVA